MQNSVDNAVAIELQAQAWQPACGIEADGAIETDRELEHRSRAVGASGRRLEAGDPGNVGDWGDIHRHRHRCARHQATVGTVVTGHHREGAEAITVGVNGGCPEGLGVAG